MFTVVIIMAAGMLAGYLLRKHKKLISLSERLVMWAIYLLLFLLGVTIGVNDQILERFAEMGWLAFIIAVGGIGGSILIGWLVFTFFLKSKTGQL
ncbi:MAG: lysine exporter LysO family protein [Bacteroidales bacterium]|nr:lysine exporter LysO family protein [Bacteroidales bacterium]